MPDRTVVCISANPALDRQLRLPALSLGEVNRALRAVPLAGGKAAHVALSARALGARTIWIGFLGGAIGEECAAELQKLDVETIAIRTKSSTRVNVEIIEDSGRLTEILEPGGAPDTTEQAEMLRVVAEGLRSRWKGALVAISGSIPAGVAPDFYVSIIEAVRDAGSKVFVDTSGDGLHASIRARPDFVKPNRRETELLFGGRLNDIRAVENASKQLLRDGAQSSAITLGPDGIIWNEGNGGPIWLARPPRLKAISTVACGDATLAGFAWAALNRWSGDQALRFATACGAANCLAEIEGRISASDVQSLIPQIEVNSL
ncbi:MAG: 1-phosphofructokinase family hexose kinase [Candidatus Acidiferrales bacterium]